jgi:hypothetical protein
MCVFSDTLESVFGSDDVRGAMSDEVLPLFVAHPGGAPDDGAVIPLFAEKAAS